MSSLVTGGPTGESEPAQWQSRGVDNTVGWLTGMALPLWGGEVSSRFPANSTRPQWLTIASLEADD